MQSPERRLPAGSPRTEAESGGQAGVAASPLCDLRKRSPKRTLTSFGQPERAGRPRSDCMDSVQLNCQL